MDKKTFGLIIGVVALIIGIGVSFAFFTAQTNTGTNKGNEVGNTTEEIPKTKVEYEEFLKHNDTNIYPGHKSISALKVTATGVNETVFNITWNGINTLGVDYKYTIYKTASEERPEFNCEVKEADKENVGKIYFEECTSDLSVLGEAVTSGTINQTSEIEKQNIALDQRLQATQEGNTVYYYVLFEFPNIDSNQSTHDKGKFEGAIELDVLDDLNAPTITYALGEHEEGENNWYKSLKLILEAKDESGVTSLKYCTTTSETCTPTTEALNPKSATITFENNASEQKVCAKAIDLKNNESEVICSNTYKVDGEKPTISIASNQVKAKQITINLNSKDDYSKINTYYYKIGSEEYKAEKIINKTFLNLQYGTNYQISVYAKDNAGNTSEVIHTTLKTLKGETMDEILATYNSSTRTDFSTVYTSETTKTVFTANDGLGTSKYFAGAPSDNYVKFAGFYWRIIRINGDKTTRLIYAGEASTIDALSNKQAVLANGYDDYTTQYTQIKKSTFNESARDNAYVGFKYDTGSLRGTTNKSTILGELDTWYEANLKTNYGKYIDGSTGFCGDRTPSTSETTSNGSGGTGKTVTYYGDYIRLKTNKSPVLTCADSGDLYTTSSSGRGNKSLTNPVGLINANELAFAGGVYGSDNTNYYLRTNNDYWAMSPCALSKNNYIASVFGMDRTGRITGYLAYGITGARPVINLASTTLFTGSGTWDDPFTVVES